MTWADLRQRASRGDLRPDSQVRQGDVGAFIQAGEVPGLLGPAVDEPRETPWFCEVLGSELGPMSWKELCLLGERGTLRGNERVRCGDGAWVPAASVVGLVKSAAASPDRSAAPPTKVSELASALPTKAVASPAPPPSEPRQPKQAVDEKASPVAPGPPAPYPPTLSPATAAPSKILKKTARTRAAGPRISVQLPGKSLAVLAGGLLIACAGYFGWTLWPPRAAPPDRQRVAALYRQAYEQIKQFRNDPQQSPAGLQFQFSRIVSSLRKQIEQSSGDASAGRLVEAATQLTQMLADCQAAGGSPEASRFADSEQRFLAILDSFQTQP
jgi:hypothetical protein